MHASTCPSSSTGVFDPSRRWARTRTPASSTSAHASPHWPSVEGQEHGSLDTPLSSALVREPAIGGFTSSAAFSILTLFSARMCDRTIFARRCARLAFGAMLCATGFVLAAVTALNVLSGSGMEGTAVFAPTFAHASTEVALCGWMVAVVATPIVWAMAYVHTVWRDVGRIGDRYLVSSTAAPALGAALVLPQLTFVFVDPAGLSGIVFGLVVSAAAACCFVRFLHQEAVREVWVLHLAPAELPIGSLTGSSTEWSAEHGW